MGKESSTILSSSVGPTGSSSEITRYSVATVHTCNNGVTIQWCLFEKHFFELHQPGPQCSGLQ